MNSVSAEVANLAINEALLFAGREAEQLRRELEGAKFANECHLRTIMAQQAIIEGQAKRLAELEKGK